MENIAVVEIINGLLWAVCGGLIVVWLLVPDPLIESIIWWGFAIACILGGILMVKAALDR